MKHPGIKYPLRMRGGLGGCRGRESERSRYSESINHERNLKGFRANRYTALREMIRG